jgi:hypothetical protein
LFEKVAKQAKFIGIVLSWKGFTTHATPLPATFSEQSQKTYLEGGAVLGLGSNGMYAGDIEVLGAVPLIR